jgi:hypothetical protein
MSDASQENLENTVAPVVRPWHKAAPMRPGPGQDEDGIRYGRYGIVAFFILFFICSVPFGYDPPQVLLMIIGVPIFIAGGICIAAFCLALILSILR